MVLCQSCMCFLCLVLVPSFPLPSPFLSFVVKPAAQSEPAALLCSGTGWLRLKLGTNTTFLCSYLSPKGSCYQLSTFLVPRGDNSGSRSNRFRSRAPLKRKERPNYPVCPPSSSRQTRRVHMWHLACCQPPGAASRELAWQVLSLPRPTAEHQELLLSHLATPSQPHHHYWGNAPEASTLVPLH